MKIDQERIHISHFSNVVFKCKKYNRNKVFVISSYILSNKLLSASMSFVSLILFTFLLISLDSNISL